MISAQLYLTEWAIFGCDQLYPGECTKWRSFHQLRPKTVNVSAIYLPSLPYAASIRHFVWCEMNGCDTSVDFSKRRTTLPYVCVSFRTVQDYEPVWCIEICENRDPLRSIMRSLAKKCLYWEFCTSFVYRGSATRVDMSDYSVGTSCYVSASHHLTRSCILSIGIIQEQHIQLHAS